MKEFDQQVAIVTGAGQGIGFEICRHLASHGARVILNDIDQELTINATKKINEEFAGCYGLPGDAADPIFIEEMIQYAVKSFGKVTIAIANAGITPFGEFLSYTPGDFQKVLQTNLVGSFFLAQAASLQMKEQKKQGEAYYLCLPSQVTRRIKTWLFTA